jgi:hypothetical protein
MDNFDRRFISEVRIHPDKPGPHGFGRIEPQQKRHDLVRSTQAALAFQADIGYLTPSPACDRSGVLHACHVGRDTAGKQVLQTLRCFRNRGARGLTVNLLEQGRGIIVAVVSYRESQRDVLIDPTLGCLCPIVSHRADIYKTY